MKKCPNCNSEVENNFDLCWNCQYIFSDDDDSNDIKTICPKCQKEFDTYLDYLDHEDNCPLNDYHPKNSEKSEGTKKIKCLRCTVPLNFEGNFKFHEGMRFGAFGNLLELFTNRESFDLYSCPNCGKIEFFLPGFD